MRTKEEILDSFYQPKMHWASVNREMVLQAMEEYAAQSHSVIVTNSCTHSFYRVDNQWKKCINCGTLAPWGQF